MTTAAKITTRRLRLLALTAGQLRLYLVEPGQLERELSLKPSLAPADAPRRRAIRLKLPAASRASEASWLWRTYWLIVAGDAGVGLAGFKGPPDDAGRVEIGYGIEDGHRRQGYATEAVGALVDWALAKPACRAVTARTHPANEASIAVLRKVGFQLSGADERELLWQISGGDHR